MTKTLITDQSVEWTELEPGIKRKIMTYNNQMMIVKVAFEKDAVGTLHQHPHTQTSYVSKGIFDVTIDGKTQRLGAGDVFLVPTELMHGVLCIESGELVDVFAPMRADFI